MGKGLERKPAVEPLPFAEKLCSGRQSLHGLLELFLERRVRVSCQTPSRSRKW